MRPTPPGKLLEIATPLAVQAAECLMRLRQSPLVKERKSDHSLVTNADHESDRMIREGLRRAFPEHAILTEESGLDGSREAEYVWVVDPLDGTRAYAKGIAGFCVHVGLLKDGKPYAGILVDPWEGHIYEAVKGHGAFHTLKGKRQPVQVSKRREWNEMPVITSTGFPPAVKRDIIAQFQSPWLPEINSMGIKIGYLVRQLADLYIVVNKSHYWDTLAPEVVLTEAGGTFTYVNGDALRYDLSGDYCHPHWTAASNGARHEDFIREFSARSQPVP